MDSGGDDGGERRNASARVVDAVGVTITTAAGDLGGADMDDRGHDIGHMRSAAIDSTVMETLCRADMDGEGDNVGERCSASAGEMAPIGVIATVLWRLLSQQ